MKYHLRYLVLVIRHKYYVFKAGLIVGHIPLWRLLIHDYTKFSKAEWTPYVNRFMKGRAGVFDRMTDDADEWHYAWVHHYTRNPHHWEYWTDPSQTYARNMSVTYVHEMVADWMGASRAYTGSWDITDWYNKHKDKMVLQVYTREYVEALVKAVGEVYNARG